MSLANKVLQSDEFNYYEKVELVTQLNKDKGIDHIERIPVESSNIESIGYSGYILEVEFQGGSVYRYPEVPIEVYKELMEADSHGSYFHRNVKEAGYDYYQVK